MDGTDYHVVGSKSYYEFFDARAATHKEWSSQPPDHNSVVWKGGAELGAGAFGAAFVFYCEDDKGIVTDRIAVKDTCVAREHWVGLFFLLRAANH